MNPTDHSDGESTENARGRRIRRAAWSMGLFAVVVYLGFIVWTFIAGASY